MTKEETIEVAVEERELPICPYEFNIGWKYKDGPIIGKVDEAWFRECDMGVARAYLYAFDKSTITKDLDWALGYWLCQRDAVPSHNKAKCKVC